MARTCKSVATREMANLSKEEREKLEFHERAQMSGAIELYTVPKDMRDGARKWYQFLLNKLLETNVLLCDLDIPTLRNAANCLAMLEECDNELVNQPLVAYRISARNIKEPVENPFFKARERLIKEWQGYCKQFGFDPSARANFANTQLKNAENAADPLLGLINNK